MYPSHNKATYMCNFVLFFYSAATILPIKPVITAVTTTPYSVNISWVVQLISFDTEIYSIQYGSDNMSL